VVVAFCAIAAVSAGRMPAARSPRTLPEERERRRPTLHTVPITVAVGAILRFVSEAVRPPNAFLSATRGRTIHPLLGGEGRGEGERSSHFPVSASLEHFAQSDRAGALIGIETCPTHGTAKSHKRAGRMGWPAAKIF